MMLPRSSRRDGRARYGGRGNSVAVAGEQVDELPDPAPQPITPIGSRAPSPAPMADRSPSPPRYDHAKDAREGSAQAVLTAHWKKFKKGRMGRPTMVLPHNPYAASMKDHPGYGAQQPMKATAHYNEAAAMCKAKVEKIVKECRKMNQRYRDYHFDLKEDEGSAFGCLTTDSPPRFTVDGLECDPSMAPGAVRRVDEIFDDAKFYVNGATAGDIKQGQTGDCWFLAALATITNIPQLLEKVVIARDEEVGVYGFVFHRDGEWISTVIDDQLFLTFNAFQSATNMRSATNFRVKEQTYNQTFLKGSEALYFGQCADDNETWLPLLEKAYAKAHGDYSSISGGWAGEAVEDLTGGVTVEINTYDILSKERFWKEELLEVNKTLLFGASITSDTDEAVSGILPFHAYSVLKAIEIDGQRLVLVRNPWGQCEYNGPWSDGSKEWTSEWIQKVQHTFGDDGSFWMSYKDFLRIFTELDRTRLFDDSWNVTSAWVSEAVEWENVYSKNRFQLRVPKAGKVVIVLQQLDDRYFKGLEGEYDFFLHFRVHREGEADYIVRSKANVTMGRSVNTEVDLEEGTWDVLYRIVAKRSKKRKPVQDVVRDVSTANRKKFLQLGMSYDLAHAKGIPSKDETVDKNEQEAEKEEKKEEEKDTQESDKAEKDKKDTEGKQAEMTKDNEQNDDGKKEETGIAQNKEEGGSATEGDHKNGKDGNEHVVVEIPAKNNKEKSHETAGDSKNAVKDDKQGDKEINSDRRSRSQVRGENQLRSTAASRAGSHARSRAGSQDPAERQDDRKGDSTSKDKKDDDDTSKPKKPLPSGRYILVPEEDDKDDDPVEENVWNPVAVVGLRVYSQCDGLTIEIVRPKKAMKRVRLDPDDLAHDASEPTPENADKSGEETKGDEDPKDGGEKNDKESSDTKNSDDATKPTSDEKSEGGKDVETSDKDTSEQKDDKDIQTTKADHGDNITVVDITDVDHKPESTQSTTDATTTEQKPADPISAPPRSATPNLSELIKEATGKDITESSQQPSTVEVEKDEVATTSVVTQDKPESSSTTQEGATATGSTVADTQDKDRKTDDLWSHIETHVVSTPEEGKDDGKPLTDTEKAIRENQDKVTKSTM